MKSLRKLQGPRPMLSNAVGALRRRLRAFARNAGYEISSSQKYGVDMTRDVSRLCAAWSRQILVAVDVGANVGQTAQQFHRVFPAARIFSFEPTPGTFAQLRDGTRHLSNVKCYQMALGSEPGIAEFHVYEYSQANSLVPTAPHQMRYASVGRKIECEVTSLDVFCSQQAIERVNLLKIDTEGSDLAVLHGAREMLSSARIDFIYVEFNDILPISGAAGGGLLPICEFLSPFGFHFVASYTDFVEASGDLFVVSNALLART